jgi:cell wall-associated NlpC family hydrolase
LKIDFAGRARALVGTPFRLQGRGTGGLDCVGLALDVFGIPGARRNYRMRGNHAGEVCGFLGRDFRRVPPSRLRPGDLILMQVADDQLHIAVRTEAGFVHAHAGLRRVVETPGLPQWPLLGIYRRRRR